MFQSSAEALRQENSLTSSSVLFPARAPAAVAAGGAYVFKVVIPQSQQKEADEKKRREVRQSKSLRVCRHFSRYEIARHSSRGRSGLGLLYSRLA